MAKLDMRMELKAPINVCVNICRTTIITCNGRVRDAQPLCDEPVLSFSLPPNLRDFIPVQMTIQARRIREDAAELLLTASQGGFAGPARVKSLELSLGRVSNVIACEYEKYKMWQRP